MTSKQLPRRSADGEPTNLGRPLGLTDDLTRDLVRNLRIGATQDAACDAVGLPRATFYAWTARARQIRKTLDTDPTTNLLPEETTLLEFLDAVTHARARGKVEALAYIRKAMSEDWRAAAWFLERSFPAEYGRRDALLVESAESLRVTIRWPDEPEIEDAELVEELEE